MQNPPHVELLGSGRPDGLQQLELARAGDPVAVAWVLDNIDRALQDGRLDALQLYLGIPNTPARLFRHLRDVAICEADRHLEGKPWSRAVALEHAWNRFVACAAWTATLAQATPPAELQSGLRRALWWASKYSGGKTLTARQLSNILGAT